MTTGEQTDPESFDIGAGAPCLDLANTVSGRGQARETDLIGSYADLVTWARLAGLVGDGEASRLLGAAERHPRRAARVVRLAVALREAIYRLFAAVAAGERPPPSDLARLNESVARALGRLRVADSADGPHWTWEADATALDRVLWPVSRSAAELLTSDDLLRVRECASATCHWLFLDGSRNRSRRWCDMNVCGNRDKVRRHYRRTRRAAR
jgi:predicted RNA-binding Zn ribbon-like protein